MNSTETRSKEEKNLSLSKKWLIGIIAIIVLTDIAVLLDIPVLRLISGFVFLTFIPGLLLIYLLKLNKLGLTERIVLIVGLSVAFLMFFGLIINWVPFALGYTTPLSAESLIISFSIIFIILGFAAYKRNKGTFSFSWSDLRFDTKDKAFLLLPVFFPLLSILGMRLMNSTDNNILLMVLLFMIPAYVIFIAIFNRKVSEKVYPSLILLISISLILLLALRSNYIIGGDTHQEYYFFQLVSSSQHWQVFGTDVLDACLIISLLPAIYQSMVNIDPQYLFKILYPVLFSVAPLVIYIISKKYIGSFYAFLASCFFMSQSGFLGTEQHARTNISILFVALAIMVLFHDKITGFNKRLLFIIFVASTLVSHYSTSYVFLFILLFTWIGMQVIPRLIERRRKVVTQGDPIVSEDVEETQAKSNPQKRDTTDLENQRFGGFITISTIGLFFAMLFFWYSQLTQLPFRSGVNFMYSTFLNLNRFFMLEARSEGTTAAFGEGIATNTIPEQIMLVVSWMSIIFIAIAVLTLLLRQWRGIALSSEGKGTAAFPPWRPEIGYLILSAACCLILVISVALPALLRGYGMDRLYLQMMVVLPPFFVIGGIMVARLLRVRLLRALPYWIVLVVLIPYLLYNVGVLDQSLGNSKEITLNSAGYQYEVQYTHDQDSNAAKWLGSHIEGKNAWVYHDGSGNMLLSHAGVAGLKNAVLGVGERTDSYIYLRYYNVVDGKLLDSRVRTHNIAEYQNTFIDKSKIYSNGGSEIWK